MGTADPAEPTDRFGSLLRSYRRAAGLTQEELAQRAGLSVKALSNMERGRTVRPFVRSARLIADALDLGRPARTQLMGALSSLRDRGEEAAPSGPGSLPGPGRGLRPLAPRQLPAPVPHFAGRAAELKILSGLLDQSIAGNGAVVISAIGGTAGVGKTALAVHWAHHVAGRFPDGQLYVNLRGFDPSGAPVTTAEAMRGFLEALKVPPAQIPSSLDAQAGLYRTLLADRQMLVVLDNAADADHVRPLLPGNRTCFAVVTSRRQLAGLAAVEGAQLLSLDVLTLAEARELMALRLGPERLAAEPDIVDALIGQCARLPLALSIAAASAAARPEVSLTTLAAELHDSRRRLDVLDAGDAMSSVRALFSWSYRNLSAPAARMFRLIGVHAGPDITLPAAASLAGKSPDDAGRELRELTRSHLLTEHVPGRFAFHDLLRAYSVERGLAEDQVAERRAATHRALDHYLRTAHAAALLLTPSREPITSIPPQPGAASEHLNDYEQALTWLKAERQVLHAASRQAADSGFNNYAWQLPWALVDFLSLLGRWPELSASQQLAVAAAQRLGDLEGQAHAHRGLGRVLSVLGPQQDATSNLAQALGLFRQLGDATGQAITHLDIGGVLVRASEYRAALSHAEQALSLFQSSGHRVGQGYALNAVAWSNVELGHYDLAIDYCQQALDLNRELNERSGEAAMLDTLARAYHHLGQHAEAASRYAVAIDLLDDLGDRPNLASVLIHLGDTQQDAGDWDSARESWRRALDIFGELHHPDADEARTRLGRLG